MKFVRIAAIFIICIFVMQWLHELGHALMARSLGYDVTVTINRVSPADGSYASSLHANLITAAGPAVTIAIAIAAFAFRRSLGALAPIILFNALTMRSLAAAVSVSNPNDEAALSLNLGLGAWALPVLVCLTLFVLFGWNARENSLGWKWYLAAWLGTSVGYSIVVFGEAALPSFAM